MRPLLSAPWIFKIFSTVFLKRVVSADFSFKTMHLSTYSYLSLKSRSYTVESGGSRHRAFRSLRSLLSESQSFGSKNWSDLIFPKRSIFIFSNMASKSLLMLSNSSSTSLAMLSITWRHSLETSEAAEVSWSMGMERKSRKGSKNVEWWWLWIFLHSIQRILCSQAVVVQMSEICLEGWRSQGLLKTPRESMGGGWRWDEVEEILLQKLFLLIQFANDYIEVWGYIYFRERVNLRRNLAWKYSKSCQIV